MDRQNRIRRLVARKLQNPIKPGCVPCFGIGRAKSPGNSSQPVRTR